MTVHKKSGHGLVVKAVDSHRCQPL